MFPHYCLRLFDSFLHMIMRSKLETSRNAPPPNLQGKDEKKSPDIINFCSQTEIPIFPRSVRLFISIFSLFLVTFFLTLCIYWRLSVPALTSLGATCEWVIIHYSSLCFPSVRRETSRHLLRKLPDHHHHPVEAQRERGPGVQRLRPLLQTAQCK